MNRSIALLLLLVLGCVSKKEAPPAPHPPAPEAPPIVPPPREPLPAEPLPVAECKADGDCARKKPKLTKGMRWACREGKCVAERPPRKAKGR